MKSAKKKPMRASDEPARGPLPDRLKINGNWKAMIKTSFLKKRPKDGWPKV